MLRVKWYKLTRKTLATLTGENGGPLHRDVLDAYFTILGKVNKELQLSHDVSVSCLMINSTQSQRIFTQSTGISEVFDIFTYDMILIPVYVNYWILIVIDFQKKAVFCWDPTMDFEFIDSIVLNLTQYLQTEAQLSLCKTIDSSLYQNLTIEKCEVKQKFLQSESGVFVCRQAEIL